MIKPSLSGLSLEEQIAYLSKGTVDLVRTQDLEAKLRRSNETGKPLRVKVGFDPSAPDIHLGHTVVMRKMKHFQDLGHEVVFLIGDFTGLIGDPSGKSKTRPQLTKQQVLDNAETYKEQVFKILDAESTIVEFNSKWLGALGAEGFIRLASHYTVARILERDDFSRRFESQQPIAIHEFLYPLAQAYDSVALKADFELGGTDQLFNLLVGRHVMKEYDLEPQVVMTMPLLEGLDGVEKMSKSLGNYIGVTDAPDDMFGKVMSISDELMYRYYELVTDKPVLEIEELKKRVASGAMHPMQAKMDLATAVVTDFHGGVVAESAKQGFSSVFRDRGVPEDMPEYRLEAPARLSEILVAAAICGSKTEVRRLLNQGGISIDGDRTEEDRTLDPVPESIVIKVGKRRFLRVTGP